ncbi:unnamed protein product [Timema podura]|uniref:Uncharacterized protein n=1 Tax=Timema podura TaxID=61482 RepID=A0ABN7NFG4_TIMPD|nr:unnamed protein product [Timema podura]
MLAKNSDEIKVIKALGYLFDPTKLLSRPSSSDGRELERMFKDLPAFRDLQCDFQLGRKELCTLISEQIDSDYVDVIYEKSEEVICEQTLADLMYLTENEVVLKLYRAEVFIRNTIVRKFHFNKVVALIAIRFVSNSSENGFLSLDSGLDLSPELLPHPLPVPPRDHSLFPILPPLSPSSKSFQGLFKDFLQFLQDKCIK